MNRSEADSRPVMVFLMKYKPLVALCYPEGQGRCPSAYQRAPKSSKTIENRMGRTERKRLSTEGRGVSKIHGPVRTSNESRRKFSPSQKVYEVECSASNVPMEYTPFNSFGNQKSQEKLIDSLLLHNGQCWASSSVKLRSKPRGPIPKQKRRSHRRSQIATPQTP